MIRTTLPDRDLGPTLGYEVIDWAHTSMIHGPGPLFGQPYRMSPLFQLVTLWAYEVFPQGHPLAGHRRWSRVVIIIRKGAAKTEWMSIVTGAETHPAGPVRTCRWTEDGRPVGAPKATPYIPLLAYNAEQSGDLAFSVLSQMVSHEACPTRADWSVTKDEISRADGTGKVQALSTSPGRDGALTTMQGFDETHRMRLPRHHEAHSLMLENAEKNLLLDAWSLETTTMHEPGRDSISERAEADASALIEANDQSEHGFLFFHVSADPELDQEALNDDDVRMQALLDASGVDAGLGLPRSRLESIHARWHRPNTDRPYIMRAWMGLPASSAGKFVEGSRWDVLAEERDLPEDGAAIAVGFDGSTSFDATVLIGVDLSSGWSWPIGIWQPPDDWPANRPWRVPRTEVETAVAATFARWRVAKMLCDPPRWEQDIARWRGRYGAKVVREYHTAQTSRIAERCWSVGRSIEAGEWTHQPATDDLTRRWRAHVLAAEREQVDSMEMPDETFAYTLVKPASQARIDGAVGLVLGQTARAWAVADGALEPGSPGRTPAVHGGDQAAVDGVLAEMRRQRDEQLERLRNGRPT